MSALTTLQSQSTPLLPPSTSTATPSPSITTQQQQQALSIPTNNANLLALKAKVSEQLNEKGLLGRLRAELRANIYAILHETSISQGKPPLFGENIKLNRLRSSREGRILLDMIAEFMEFFEMQQTLTVFSAECSLPEHFDPKLRPVITKEIGLPVLSIATATGEILHPEEPLLLMLLKQYERTKASHADLTGSRRMGGSAGNLVTSNPSLSKSDPTLRVDTTGGKIVLQQQPQQQQRKVILGDGEAINAAGSPKRENIDLLPESSSPRQTQSPVGLPADLPAGTGSTSPAVSPRSNAQQLSTLDSVAASIVATVAGASAIATKPLGNNNADSISPLPNFPIEIKKRGTLPPLSGPSSFTPSQEDTQTLLLPKFSISKSIEDIPEVDDNDNENVVQLADFAITGTKSTDAPATISGELNISLESISPPPQWQGSFNDSDKDLLTSDRTLSADALNDIDEIPFDYEERVESIEF